MIDTLLDFKNCIQRVMEPHNKETREAKTVHILNTINAKQLWTVFMYVIKQV